MEKLRGDVSDEGPARCPTARSHAALRMVAQAPSNAAVWIDIV